MLRQTFVQKRVVGVQQIQCSAVLENDAFEKHFRLPRKALPQVVIEVREDVLIRAVTSYIAQIQPLSRKVAAQRPGALIRQHPPDLLFKNRRILELALNRQVQ